MFDLHERLLAYLLKILNPFYPSVEILEISDLGFIIRNKELGTVFSQNFLAIVKSKVYTIHETGSSASSEFLYLIQKPQLQRKKVK